MSGSSAADFSAAFDQALPPSPAASAAAPVVAAVPAASSAPATMGDVPVIDVGGATAGRYDPSVPIGQSGSEMAPSLVSPGGAASGAPVATPPPATATPAGSGAAAVPPTTATAPGTATGDFSSAFDAALATAPAATSKAAPSSPSSTQTASSGSDSKPGQLTGSMANLAAGGNSAISGLLGAPVDLTTDALNLGIRGINAGARALGVAPSAPTVPQLIAGQNTPTPLIPQIQNPVGGSHWINQAMGLIGANPENVVAQPGTADTLMRNIGSNVAGALMPLGIAGQGARLLDAAGQAAPVARGVMQTLAAPSALSTAAAGVGAGAGQTAGQAATAGAPDWVQDLAGTAGSVLGGGVSALGEMGAKGVAQGVQNAGQSFFAPVMSDSPWMRYPAALVGADVRPQTFTAPDGSTVVATPARMAKVQSQLAAKAGMSPESLESSIPAPDASIPGVKQSMATVTGNPGLAAQESVLRARNPASWNGIDQANNNARVAGFKANADPAVQANAASQYVKTVQRQLDQDAAAVEAQQRAVSAPAIARAQTPETLGGAGSRVRTAVDAREAPKLTAAQQREEAASRRYTEAERKSGNVPEAREDATPRQQLGAEFQNAVAAKDAALRARTSRFYKAMDPDGKWAVADGAMKSAARSLRSEYFPEQNVTPSAQVEGWLKAFEDGPGVIKFGALRAMRAKIGVQQRMAARAGDADEARQLGILKGGIDDAVDEAVRLHARTESPHINQGNIGPDDSLVGRLAQFERDQRGGVYTASGRRVDVQHEVVEADSLVPSHTDAMQPNPKFPQELQPRDRNRAASEVQVSQMARNLQPERLGASSTATDGAPIVGPDNLVESGNARVLAVRRAYQNNGPVAANYRAWLERQGVDTTGMKAPVMIRRRMTEMTPEDRQSFAQEANQSSGLTMGAAERAQSDARGLSDRSMGLYQPGDVTSAANRPFATSVARDLAANDPGAFGTAKGELSIEGAQRIRNALLQKAYGDPELVHAIAEGGSDDIKAFGAALTDAAGPMAKLRADIAAGRVDPHLDITPNLVEAARLVRMARASGLKLSDVVGQQDAFSPVSAETERILQFAYGPNLSGRIVRLRVAAYLQNYAEEAAKQETSPRLFGENLSRGQLLKAVGDRNGSAGPDEATAEPGVSETARQGDGADGSQAGGSGAGASRTGSTGGSSRTVVREPPPTESNLTAADAAAYARGRASKVLQVQRTAGLPSAIIKQGNGTDFAMPTSVVGSKIWNGRPEDVQQIANLLGPARAEKMVGDYAALDLRSQKGLMKDGVPDPKVINNWIAAHQEQFNVFPGLRQRFGTVARAAQELSDVSAQRQAIEAAHPLARIREDSAVMSTKYMLPGGRGTEAAQAFMRDTGGSPQAVEALSDGLATRFQDKAMRDGQLNTQAARQFLQDFKPLLDGLPASVRSRFENAASAQQAVEDMATRRVQQLKAYQDSAARFYLKQAGDEADDPVKAIGRLMGSENPQLEAARLMKIMRTDPGGVAPAAMKRNAIDYVLKGILNTKGANAADGDAGEISNARLTDMLNDPQRVAALKELAGEDSVKFLQKMQEQVQAELKTRNKATYPGQSITATLTHGIQEHGEGGEHDPSIAAQVVGAEMATEGAVGLIEPHSFVARMGVKAVAAVGAIIASAARKSGLAETEDLLRVAAQNPDTIGRLILTQPTKAAGVTLRTKLQGLLGNLSVAGYVSQQR